MTQEYIDGDRISAFAFSSPERTNKQTNKQKKIRRLLFDPSDDELRDDYPLLMHAAPAGAPQEHPLYIVLKTFISSFYLTHVKIWKRVENFIIGGGLLALSDLFVHENLYIRSQAM